MLWVYYKGGMSRIGAFVEMRENRHSIKGYTDVNLMVKDILEEDE